MGPLCPRSPQTMTIPLWSPSDAAVYGGVAALTLLVAYTGTAWRRLAAIPTVGGTDIPLLSLKGCYRFVTDGMALLQEGYERHKGRAFKVAMPDRWLVILSGSRLTDELRSLPQDVMSFDEGANQLIEIQYVLNSDVAHNAWHSDLVRTHLNKRLDTFVPIVRDEVVAAFDEYVGSTESGWVSVPAVDLVQKVICRASNRIFVGLPTCRDKSWIDINVEFTSDLMNGRNILSMLPPFLKPLAAKFLTTILAKKRRARQHLEPVIAERRQQMEDGGKDHSDRPDDMLTWILADSRSRHESVEALAIRMLALNFTAIHTTANACGTALLTLAAYPEYVAVLREEVETLTQTHGWTRTAVGEMAKLDSFVKECNRYWSPTAFGLIRCAMKTHTFSDGTTVPAGTLVCVSPVSIYCDEENYPDAGKFKPFRFVEQPDAKRQFTATSIEHVTFGHGKHACPGRFFASNEIKLILSHILMNYDVRTEVDGVRPPDFVLGPQQMPNPAAKILFKKRVN